MRIHRSAVRKQTHVPAALPGEENLCQRQTLEYPQPGAQIDPIFQRTEARRYRVRMAPLKTLFSNFGINHARGVAEGAAGLRYCRAVYSDARPHPFLFSWRLVEVRISESETEPCFPRIRRWTQFRIDRQPESGLFLSRFLRCSLKLAADISTGNLDADLVCNLDCQR